MSTDSFAPRVVDGGVRLGSHKNVAIAIWGPTKSKGVTESLAGQNELVAYLTSKYPEGVVMNVVIAQGAEVPNSAQRKELEAFFARWTPSLRALSQAVEGSDLWSVTCRSIMTAMSLVQRRPYPSKMFSEAAAGAQWAAEYMSRADGQSAADAARDLERAIEELRRLPI